VRILATLCDADDADDIDDIDDDDDTNGASPYLCSRKRTETRSDMHYPLVDQASRISSKRVENSRL
jgi:hypothetical protein